MIDWNYKRIAKKLNFPIEKNRQTDLSNFPIEAARMQIALPVFLTGAAAIIGYGWLMAHKVSLAGPIIMLFLIGYCLIAGTQVSLLEHSPSGEAAPLHRRSRDDPRSLFYSVSLPSWWIFTQ